jgi:hypothetical protein
MIVLGLFIAKDERRYWGWGLAVVAFIIGIVIIFQAFDRLGYIWGMGFLDSEFIGFIVLAILLVGIIIAVAAGGREKEGVAKTVADFIGWRKND